MTVTPLKDVEFGGQLHEAGQETDLPLRFVLRHRGDGTFRRPFYAETT